jgi:hypothetical protein
MQASPSACNAVNPVMIVSFTAHHRRNDAAVQTLDEPRGRYLPA